MAHVSWLKFFPSAYRALVVDLADGHTCEKCFEEIVKEYDEHITWLHEIPGEVMDKFAVKSTKFNQLPKTPSVRARATRKTRRQVATFPDIDENIPLEILPKKLDFDDDRSQSESEAPSRPKRSCRKKTSTHVDEQPARSTRQSRKQLSRNNCDMPPEAAAEIFKEKNPVPDESCGGASGKEGVKAVNLDVKKTASPAPLNKSVTNNSSPSVKDRANAYENMLKTKQTPNSPFKGKRGLTPNAASPSFTAATISSQAKASPNPSSAKSRPSKTRAALRSSHRRSSRRSSASRSKKKAPAKPLRSKLRLKKQKPKTNDEEKENGEEAEDEEDDKAYIKGQESDMDTVSAEITKYAETQKAEDEKEDATASADVNMNETQVVVTEVFELFNDGKKAELKELEVVKTKTTPLKTETVLPATNTASTIPTCHRFSSDQGFDEGDQDASSESSESNTNVNSTFTKAQPTEMQGRSTRTRTKKVHDNTNVASSSVCVPVEIEKAQEPTESPEKYSKSTRTRTRAMKTKEDNKVETVEVECARTTRTRQRKAEVAQAEDNCIRDVNVLKPTAPTQESLPSEVAPFRSTRSKMRKVDHAVVDGKDDEVITGSPAIKSPTVMRLQKKRLVEERGNSPRPKRSCVDETSHLESIPMSTSSPVQQKELDRTVDSMNNSILSPMRQKNRPYLFNSAQKKINGFLNRTPGFANNTKVLTFFGSAPSHRNNGTLTSFLKRNTPPPKATFKDIQEQKKQRLLEKESKDNERIQRAAEARRQKLKEQKRCRDERLKKVADQRVIKERREQELKEQIKRKHEDKAASKEKLMEEKLKAENEKQKQRLRKQMEADARRRQEEEERMKKWQEQEEDARRQEELMQRKRDYEELERKRQMAEEKRRYDEKMAEKEQKKLEEIALKKKREEERERETERMKREREKHIAQERAERERMEREKREDRERKMKEAEERERLRIELEMLKEKQRLKDLEEARRNQAKLNEMQKLINQHNQQIKSTASVNTTHIINKGSNLNTSTSSNSYQITPAVKKVYKPSENPNDYGVDEKESDDSTDDESEPKKKIPDWATWARLDFALIKQDANPPDVDAIFCTKYLKPLDLHCVFPQSKGRHKFNQRTSSAFWSSPPVKSRPRF